MVIDEDVECVSGRWNELNGISCEGEVEMNEFNWVWVVFVFSFDSSVEIMFVVRFGVEDGEFYDDCV